MNHPHNHVFCTGISCGQTFRQSACIGKIAFEFCNTLAGAIIPESVTVIDNGAFYECTGLTSVVVPNSLAIIGEAAFWRCTALTFLVIPDNVTSIGDNAFYGVCNIAYNGSLADDSSWGAKCKNGYVEGWLVYKDATKTNLRGCGNAATGDITIPESVTNIGDYAFYYCTGLAEIMRYAAAVPERATNAFDGVNKFAKLYVPKESVAAYKAHLVRGQFDLILPFSTIDIYDDSATGDKNSASQKFLRRVNSISTKVIKPIRQQVSNCDLCNRLIVLVSQSY